MLSIFQIVRFQPNLDSASLIKDISSIDVTKLETLNVFPESASQVGEQQGMTKKVTKKQVELDLDAATSTCIIHYLINP